MTARRRCNGGPIANGGGGGCRYAENGYVREDGVGGVGAVAMTFETDDSGHGSVGLGILPIIIAQFFAGTQFIVEEYFLSDYYLDPMKVVGSEGMFGLLYYLCVLPIM